MLKPRENLYLTGIQNKDNPDLPRALSLDKNGILKIPEGYRYCKGCRSLTPHEKMKGYYSCMVCGDHATDYSCDNCGYEFDIEISPGIIEIEDADDKEKLYVIYPEPFALNYSQRSVFSMDCPDAFEFEYDLICPVCRMINHFEDANC